MFLGIEIGGTKLQLGVGHGDGVITALWRGTVNPAEGSEGIRQQIVAAVPELHRVSHLPVVIDPSQGTGKSYLVDSMCRAAVAAGADGLIVEVHNDPEHAMTDGAQSITPKQFDEMMKSIKRIAVAVDREA